MGEPEPTVTGPRPAGAAARRRARDRRMTARLLRYFLMFVVWNIGASIALGLGFVFHAELVGLLLTILLAFWMVRGYLLGGEGGARRRGLIRPRPLSREGLGWTLLAIPVLLLASWSLGEVWIRLVPVPPASFDPFEAFTRTVTGKISIAVIAVALAPVLEEFFFRGLIQRTIEREYGPAPAIVTAAAIFAAAHLLPWIFPLHFFLGAAFGYAVYVTRSIWPGVILHAANNAAAVVGVVESEKPQATPTIWQTGPTHDWWLAVAGLVAAAFLLAYVARGLREAGRLRRFAPVG
jgi:membrane protease YdiL (CAAX protease family)